MSLTAQLEAKRNELAQIKTAVEGGDMEKAAQLSEAIEGVKSIEQAIAEADKADKLLKSLGSVAEKPVEDKPARTLGEFAMKHLDLSAMRNGAKSAATGYGFKAATDNHLAPQVVVTSENVVDIAHFTSIRELFGAETISGNALTYFQLGATEGAPTEVAQGATKPQFHVPYTPVTMALTKVAGWFYETDEFITDVPYLRTAVDNRGLFELRKAANDYLSNELLTASGIQSQTYTGSLTADTIFNAMMAVKSVTDYDADAILINPTDYQALRLAKDGNQQYYGGGYFYAPYGTGELSQQPGIWGLQTIVTTAVTAGTVVVGAFKAGGTVVTKAGEGAGIEVFRGDHDDAINNRVTVVVEERMGLALRVPQAFVKVSK